jgi:adenylyl cyclase-associated protein
MERVSVDDKVFHENCFKCEHCKKKLSTGNYTALENSFYCKPHYTQLFNAKGNYSEGFGKEKPTAAWAPSTATYDGMDLAKKLEGEKKPEEKKPDAKPVGGPPPPPAGGPPPPPLPTNLDVPSQSTDQNAHAAALDAIRTGGHHLKHLTKEERKQKPLSSVVPGETKKVPAKEAKEPASSAKTGPPELKLENNKWSVRYQQAKEEPIIIAITDIKQSVSINDCKNCSIIVQGKLTNIAVVSCVGVNVVFDDIIASVEAVRSSKLGIQANGKIAQIAIDKCSNVDVFIQSAQGKTVEIVTSLSDSLNVNFPGATPDDDLIEFPIPNQFTSNIANGKLICKPVEHV